MGLHDIDFAVTDRTDTMKGWFQRLFGLGDDAAKLQSKGVPPDEAQWYDNEMQRGCVLVVARADGEAPRIAEAIRSRGAHHVRVYAERGGQWERVSDTDLASDRWEKMYAYQTYVLPDVPPLGASRSKAIGSAEERRIPIREEELRTGKRTREAGEVTVHKDVVEQPVHEDVSLTREGVRIQRRPVREAMTGNVEPIREGETIRVPLTEEEVVVEKRPVVKEEVVITKERETHSHPVDETIKKEQVRVEGDQDHVRSDVDRDRKR